MYSPTQLLSLFFSILKKLLYETPRKEQLSTLETAFFVTFGVAFPLLFGNFLMKYYLVCFYASVLGSISYGIWLALYKIYKWKDSHKELED